MAPLLTFNNRIAGIKETNKNNNLNIDTKDDLKHLGKTKCVFETDNKTNFQQARVFISNNGKYWSTWPSYGQIDTSPALFRLLNLLLQMRICGQY